MAQTSLAEIKKTYSSIEDNFDGLYAACQTDRQKAELRSLHADARDALWRAVASRLDDNYDLVKRYAAELRGVNAQVESSLKRPNDVVVTLKLLTEAVKLGAAIASSWWPLSDPMPNDGPDR